MYIYTQPTSGRRRPAALPRLLLAVALLLEASAQQEVNESCQFKYEKQPPLYWDQLNCNPHGIDEGPQLTLLCEVSGPLDADFDIVWFKNSEHVCNESLVEGVECSQSNQSDNRRSICSQLTQRGEQVKAMNVYFCQVVVNGSLLYGVRSNALEIEVSGLYLNFASECDEAKYDATDACADADPLLEQNVSLCAEPTPTPSPSPSPSPSSSPSPSPSVWPSASPTSSLPPPTTSLVVDDVPSPSPALSSTAVPSASVVSDEEGGDGGGKSSETLQLWLYVVVAVAAVFAMIIIILAIMCIGLCLRKSQTGDLETLKRQESQNGRHFTSPGMWDGTDLATHPVNTHSTHVPEFSAYNSLGERDYEIVDIRDDKNEYHRLQRPHPKGSLPNGRLVSTSSTTSTQPLLTDSSRADLIPRAHQGLENPHYHVLDEVAPPLPPHNGSRAAYNPEAYNPGTVPAQHRRPTRNLSSSSARAATTPTLIYDDPHEALYSPGVIDGSGGQLRHALQTVPETGTIFPEPSDPTSFPVHVYDYVPSAIPPYEIPVPSQTTPPTAHKHSRSSLASAGKGSVGGATLESNATNTLQSLGNSDSDYPDVTSSADCTGTGEAVVNFPGVTTPLSSSAEGSPANHSVGMATNGLSHDHRFSDAEAADDSEDDFTGVPLGSKPNGRTSMVSEMAATTSLPDFSDTTDFVVRSSRCLTVGPMPLLEDPDTNTDSSDFTGPVFLPHLFDQGRTGKVPPSSNPRVRPYQTLDPLTMDPVMKYTRLNIGTVV